ncbi:MAG: MerR family transcriptional regulator, partial [Sarcina sp.]
MSEEIYFSIGQASEFLGISRDTIKFYEEKGLINPIKDDENRYRKYSMEEIHNLFLINFYRELDMEIKKIKEIKDSGYIEKVDSILEEQEDKLFIEIKKKKEILKKIKKTRQGYLNVINNIEKFSIRSLGPFKVLEEIEDIAME